jgi:hypothetical protein
MSIATAFTSGIRRVNRSPGLLVGVWLLTFLAALPLGLQLRAAIADSLGDSTAAGTAARGVDYGWWQRFSEDARGPAEAFSPTIVGGAAVVDNLSSIVDNRSHEIAIAATGFMYAIVWLMLAGGILDRYARNRKVGTFAFFSACGGYFARFVRLAIVAGLAYVALFTWLHGWLFEDIYPKVTAGWTVEWHAFALRVAFYCLFGAALCLCNLVFDYAKVRIVVEDRRSVLGATIAALRFARRRPAVLGLYLIDGCCFAILVTVYALAAPGARVSLWWTLGAGQAYLLARIWVKLLFYASEVAYFQGSLAHAAHLARPLPAWPDSPAEDIADTPAATS